jgi:hypothetical protein
MIRSVPDYVTPGYSLLPRRFPLVAKIHLVKVYQEGYENSILVINFDDFFGLTVEPIGLKMVLNEAPNYST